MSEYLVFDQRMSAEDPTFADCLAAAHARRHRPLCLCTDSGEEMYIARFGDAFILKRMPFTGSLHAPDCPSYEPPPEISGRGELLGSAIREDPASGITVLKLGFAISREPTRSIAPVPGADSDSVLADGTRLSLRGLLHYLWDEAELTRWQPAFAGRRSWATVRKHLLEAAAGKVVRGRSLTDRLYIPEVFGADRRNEIAARRLRQWTGTGLAFREPRDLLIAIAEVKEISAARFGFKAVLKHVPDQAFPIDDKLYRRMEHRFERELSLWGASDAMHMLMIATFAVREGGAPRIHELSLMPVTAEWLPVEDAFEIQLVEMLLREGRRFHKVLRYNVRGKLHVPTAILLDTVPPCALSIVGGSSDERQMRHEHSDPSCAKVTHWSWEIGRSPPPLPLASRSADNRLTTRSPKPRPHLQPSVRVLRSQQPSSS